MYVCVFPREYFSLKNRLLVSLVLHLAHLYASLSEAQTLNAGSHYFTLLLNRTGRTHQNSLFGAEQVLKWK